MKIAEFPVHILKIVQSFLKNRSFQVSVNGELSSLQQIPFGVPQGAVLSPTLYNIFTADMVMVDDVEYYLFSDDTGYVATDTDPVIIVTKLQAAQNALESFQKRWRIKINPAKTQAIFFTRRRSLRRLPQTNITAVGHPVPWSDHVKYLGITIDKKINFAKHIATSIEKCTKLIKMLYPLICRRSKLNISNKLLIFKSIFRPSLSYGFPAWHCCAQTHRKKLQVKQNKLLKMMLDLDFNHPTEDLHRLANTEPLDEWIQKLLPKFWLGCSMSENTLLSEMVP